MRHTLLVLCLLAPALGLGTSHAQDSEDAARLPAYQHASACVAVLKREAVLLSQRYKAGHTETRPEIVKLTEHGFVFIGTAYKNGLRKAQADALLDEAEKAQKQASPEALRQLLGECQTEGTRLLRDVSFIERGLIGNRAAARVDKMLAPPESGG